MADDTRPCCPVGAKFSPEDLTALGEALRAAHEKRPEAESLNAIAKRTGIRKETLIRHRDVCIANGTVASAGRTIAPKTPGPSSKTEKGPTGTPILPRGPFAPDHTGPASGPHDGPPPKDADGDGEEQAKEPSPTARPSLHAVSKSSEDKGNGNVIRGNFGGNKRPSKAEEEERARAARRQAINDAREQGMTLAAQADGYEDRVSHIADLITTGFYEGRRTAVSLSKLWGCGVTTVWNYARVAAMMVKTDRTTVDACREESLGRWRRLQEEAREAGDIKAAVAAQAGWDRASGVVEPGGAKVLINMADNPAFSGVIRKLFQALAAYPEAQEVARTAVKEALREAQQQRVLPAGGTGRR